MTHEIDFVTRLKQVREALGLKQKEFASRLSISAASYSEIEGGKYKPNYEFIYNISTQFDVNLYFLLFGKGDMFLRDNQLITADIGNMVVDREEVFRFLWYFRHSPIVQYLTLANFRSIMRKDKEAIEQEVAEYGPKEEGE